MGDFGARFGDRNYNYVEITDGPGTGPSQFISQNFPMTTEAQAQAFYNYQRQRPNPIVDDYVQQLQGASGRGLPSQAHETPRAFPPGPMNRGMTPPVTPHPKTHGTTGQVRPNTPDEEWGRFTGAASNMGSTDMRSSANVMQSRPNDPISDILVRGGGMPPMR